MENASICSSSGEKSLQGKRNPVHQEGGRRAPISEKKKKKQIFREGCVRSFRGKKRLEAWAFVLSKEKKKTLDQGGSAAGGREIGDCPGEGILRGMREGRKEHGGASGGREDK